MIFFPLLVHFGVILIFTYSVNFWLETVLKSTSESMPQNKQLIDKDVRKIMLEKSKVEDREGNQRVEIEKEMQMVKYLEEEMKTNWGVKIRIYNCLRLLHGMSNDCYSQFTWPYFVLALIVFISYGLYGVIKMHDGIRIQIFLMFPTLAIIIASSAAFLFPLVGNIFSMSGHVICSLEKELKEGDKYGQRVIKSMRPFGARVGNLFMIQRNTFLHYILAVSTITINAILLH